MLQMEPGHAPAGERRAAAERLTVSTLRVRIPFLQGNVASSVQAPRHPRRPSNLAGQRGRKMIRPARHPLLAAREQQHSSRPSASLRSPASPPPPVLVLVWCVTVGSPAARGLGIGAVASPHLISPWGGGRGSQHPGLGAALDRHPQSGTVTYLVTYSSHSTAYLTHQRTSARARGSVREPGAHSHALPLLF